MASPSCLALEISESGILSRVLSGHAAHGFRPAKQLLQGAPHIAPTPRHKSSAAPPSPLFTGPLIRRSHIRSCQTHREKASAAKRCVAKRAFSTTGTKMAAQKIDGKAIAAKIRERLRAEILEKREANPRYQPCLKIIQGESLCDIPRPSPCFQFDMLTLCLVANRGDSCKSWDTKADAQRDGYHDSLCSSYIHPDEVEGRTRGKTKKDHGKSRRSY